MNKILIAYLNGQKIRHCTWGNNEYAQLKILANEFKMIETYHDRWNDNINLSTRIEYIMNNPENYEIYKGVKEMTVAEISKKLGYEIKVVK